MSSDCWTCHRTIFSNLQKGKNQSDATFNALQNLYDWECARFAKFQIESGQELRLLNCPVISRPNFVSLVNHKERCSQFVGARVIGRGYQKGEIFPTSLSAPHANVKSLCMAKELNPSLKGTIWSIAGALPVLAATGQSGLGMMAADKAFRIFPKAELPNRNPVIRCSLASYRRLRNHSILNKKKSSSFPEQV